MITFSSEAESGWTPRFIIGTLALPAATLMLSGLAIGLLSRASGHEVVNGGVETTGVVFLVILLGTVGTMAAAFNAITHRLPADRKRYAPLPLTVSLAALAATAASSGLSPSTPELEVAVVALVAAMVGAGIGWRVAAVVLGESVTVFADVSGVAIIDQHRAGGTEVDNVLKDDALWTSLLPARVIPRRRMAIAASFYLVAMGLMINWWAALAGMALGAISTTAGNFVVRSTISIGPHGLWATTRLRRTPQLVLKFDQIVEAAVATVERGRMNSRDWKRSDSLLTVATRGGPAIRLILIDGGEVVIGLDHPAEPVALIERLLAEQG